MAPRVNLHLPYARFEEFRELIAGEHPDLEIFFSAADLDAIAVDGMGHFLSYLDYGPRLSFHGPFMDLAPGAVDDRIRAVTLDRFSRTLSLAKILNPQVIVFHSGYDRFRYGRHSDLWLENSVRTWRAVLESTPGWEGKIAIENIFEDGPDTLGSLMDAVGSPRFGICFDTGHFTLFSRTPLRKWWDVFRDRVVEIHLHDNDGLWDQHAVPGDGCFDFPELVRLLGSTTPVLTLEVHSPEAARAGVQRIRELFP